MLDFNLIHFESKGAVSFVQLRCTAGLLGFILPNLRFFAVAAG